MAQAERVARLRIETDQVPAELRLHRLRHGADCQRPCCRGELRHELLAGALAEVTAGGRRCGVVRDACREVGKYRFLVCCGHDLRTQLHDRVARGGRVLRRDGHWNRDHGDGGAGRSLEVRLVCVVEGAGLCVGNFAGLRRRRAHRDVRDLRRVVRVLVNLPEACIADEGTGRDLLEQFLLRDRGAVIPLELRQQALLARLRIPQEALVFLEVELSVRLELRQLGVLRRRRELRILDDLFFRHGDAALLVLLLEKDLGHDLVVCLLLDLRALVECERATALSFLLLDRRFERTLVRAVRDVLPVDANDRRAKRRAGFTSEESRRFIEDEAADERHGEAPEDVLTERAKRLQH